jgi:Tfp pilus assembly protein PilN
MRPVNLIPPDLRRGEQAPLRTGAFVYVVVAALIALLAGVTALVLTGNSVNERKAEVETLEVQDAAAAAKAQELIAYTQFRVLSEQRVETVRSLAESRFDWERVMRELSLILPSNVWLVNLNASAAPGVGEGGGEGSEGGGAGLRASAPGPALELKGCASGQSAVAGFVTSLEDIDGVTRVGVQSSELADGDSGAGVSAGGEAGSAETSEDCRTRKFIAQFQVVVAFDAAPVPVTGTTEAAPAEPAPEGSEAEGESESAPSEESEGEG